MTAPTKKRTPRKITQIKKTEEPTPIALMVESAPPIPEVEAVVEVIQPEPEIVTPAARRWYVIRWLPENVGTANQVHQAWTKEIAKLDKLIRGKKIQYGIASRDVDGVQLRYILAQEELINYLVENCPGYIEGGCPEYQMVQE